jgi:hypothetical protein
MALQQGEEYKDVRILDEQLPAALKPTKSGARLDLRVYFREKPDGSRWFSGSTRTTSALDLIGTRTVGSRVIYERYGHARDESD